METKNYRLHALVMYSHGPTPKWDYKHDDPEKDEPKKYQEIVFLTEHLRKKTLEEAKDFLRNWWKELMKKYTGECIEMWINDHDAWPPKRGKSDAEFYATNMHLFKSGSKHAEGTPF